MRITLLNDLHLHFSLVVCAAITFISTIHKEIVRCSPEELFKIIERLSPDVVFLEADDDTYTAYDQSLFSTYGVYHRKLEIAAIQRYSEVGSFQYVSVSDGGLSDIFHRKTKVVCQYRELQLLIENFTSLAEKHGFKFLNSPECIRFQEEMRAMEKEIIDNSDVDKLIESDIQAYEEAMIRNIYLYCKTNSFSSAIIEKIERSKAVENVDLTWNVF
ncbi:MAG: hypothetical protein U0U09_14380 [Cyclobacteriaceae bacterium]